MPGELALNPYLQFQAVGDGSEEFILSGPKKAAGIQTVRVTKTSRPEMFEAFSDFAATSLDFLEPDKDLSDADRAFLTQHGMLDRPDSLPKLPSFACKLDDVPAIDIENDRNRIKVSESFRFEPFDLTTFAAKLRNAHLSPTRPTVWARSLVYEIEMGHWLEPAQAEIVSRFVPGEPVESEVDDDLVRKLVAAEVLIDEGYAAKIAAERNAAVAAAKDSFAASGYAHLPAMLPPHQMGAYRRFYRQYVSEGFMPLGDKQVPNRFRQHNEPLAAFLHKTLRPLMSEIAGTDVVPSYVYAASYKGGASLTPHIDRPQCEFSISFQVDYEPEPDGHVSPWALCVEPLGEKPKDEMGWHVIDPNAAKAIHLASGDGLFYKGCELIHYRHALPEGHRSTSLFFHFVPADFAGPLD